MKKRCLIIGSSYVSAETLKHYTRQDDMILCADGGLTAALKAGLNPYAVIGDGDSGGINPPPGVLSVILPAEKNLTDTEECINRGFELGLAEFMLLGCMEGRADHYFANAALLEYIAQKGGSGMLAGETDEIYFLENRQIYFENNGGFKYISIIPLDRKCRVSISGVKYPLTRHEITRGSTFSVSNEHLPGTAAAVCAHEGAVLVMRCG